MTAFPILSRKQGHWDNVRQAKAQDAKVRVAQPQYKQVQVWSTKMGAPLYFPPWTYCLPHHSPDPQQGDQALSATPMELCTPTVLILRLRGRENSSFWEKAPFSPHLSLLLTGPQGLCWSCSLMGRLVNMSSLLWPCSSLELKSQANKRKIVFSSPQLLIPTPASLRNEGSHR